MNILCQAGIFPIGLLHYLFLLSNLCDILINKWTFSLSWNCDKPNSCNLVVCGSSNIHLCLHSAIAIPWCCLLSSNWISCRSHYSGSRLTRLCLDPFQRFVFLVHTGFHLEPKWWWVLLQAEKKKRKKKDDWYHQWFRSTFLWWPFERWRGNFVVI